MIREEDHTQFSEEPIQIHIGGRKSNAKIKRTFHSSLCCSLKLEHSLSICHSVATISVYIRSQFNYSGPQERHPPRCSFIKRCHVTSSVFSPLISSSLSESNKDAKKSQKRANPFSQRNMLFRRCF